MLLNQGKCQFMYIGKNLSDTESLWKIARKLKLQVLINKSSDFKSHIKNICGKAGQKLSTLLKILLHIDTDAKTVLQSLEMFLEKHQEFLTHQRNLQGLITEIYEIVNLVAPPIMNSLF